MCGGGQSGHREDGEKMPSRAPLELALGTSTL